MTNKEILKKAIEKAGTNRFDFRYWFQTMGFTYLDSEKSIVALFENPCDKDRLLGKFAEGCYLVLIFSHEFAKVFWGETGVGDGIDYGDGIEREVPAWQFHLQRMVLETEPLKYLEKFL